MSDQTIRDLWVIKFIAAFSALFTLSFISLLLTYTSMDVEGVVFFYAWPALTLSLLFSLYAAKQLGGRFVWILLICTLVLGVVPLATQAVLHTSSADYYMGQRAFAEGDVPLARRLMTRALDDMEHRVTSSDPDALEVSVLPPRIYLDRRFEASMGLATLEWNQGDKADALLFLERALPAAYSDGTHADIVPEIERILRITAFDRESEHRDDWDEFDELFSELLSGVQDTCWN